MLRLVHEAQMHEANSFVTLTYDEEHLPRDGSLDVKHWQDFAKRLRHKVGKFRFYHCGEYGDVNERPHYHAILFGQDFEFDRQVLGVKKGRPLYTSRTLEEVWGKGLTSIGEVTAESAAYVAGYTRKKVSQPPGGDDWAVSEFVERYGRWDENGEFYTVKPEYATMSRRPGIGAGWLKRYKGDVFPCDSVTMRGREYRVPRYYTDQLDEEELESVKKKRREYALRVQGDNTPERLKVREEVMTLDEQRREREL